MKKLVVLSLLILVTCSFMAVSVAESTNPNKALAALTAKCINENWPNIEYFWPDQYIKGEVQSNIVTAMNELKHEPGYEKGPYEDWQVRRIVAYIGLGLEDSDD